MIYNDSTNLNHETCCHFLVRLDNASLAPTVPEMNELPDGSTTQSCDHRHLSLKHRHTRRIPNEYPRL